MGSREDVRSTIPTTTAEAGPKKDEEAVFQGWMATDATSPLKHTSFTPKKWEEEDIDIAVTHCGICASDLHVLSSGWGSTIYPCCVGHEIIGTAIRIGSRARPGIKIGDRVGVGPQGYTCRQTDCEWCSSHQENYCPRRIGTYGDRYPNDIGISYGGFASHCRHNSYSVFSIPDALDSASAAVMLCAGSTVYEPLKEAGAGPDIKVGIIGIGGLGHLGVLFAKAMGCARVLALSRHGDKAASALELGADEYIATSEHEGWAEKYASSLDIIICTISDPRMPLSEYLSLLRPKGRFCQVGIPEAPLPALDAMGLVLNGTSISFSDSASPGNIREMLEVAAKKGIRAWTQVRPMVEVNEALREMEGGKARFRTVLVNEGGNGKGEDG